MACGQDWPTSLSLRGSCSQAQTLLGGSSLSPGTWGALFSGNADKAQDIFVLSRCVWATAMHLDPLKTRPCAILTRLVERVTNIYSLLVDIFWSAALGTRLIWNRLPKLGSQSTETAWRDCWVSSVVVACRQDWPTSLRLRALSPQARFITWCLRYPFLGECRWDPKHFCAHQVCLSYGPAPGPT